MRHARFVIHWKGGEHRIDVTFPKSAMAEQSSLESLEIIRKMAVCYGDDQIALVLNRLGHGTGKRLRLESDWRVKYRSAKSRDRRAEASPAQTRIPESPGQPRRGRSGVSNKSIRRSVERRHFANGTSRAPTLRGKFAGGGFR